MRGPAGVTALVLAELVAGSLWLLFLVFPLWHEVRPGFFKVSGTVVAALSIATWFSVRAGLVQGSDAGAWALRLSVALAIVAIGWTALLFFRRATAARVGGLVSVPLSVVLLVAMAGTAEEGAALALFQLLAGAAFLGAVLDGLLLGHWYLTDRGLSRTPIGRYATALLVAVVVEAVALVLGGFGPTGGGSEFNPLLTSAGLASWIAIGMVGTTALIAVLIRAALKGERSSAVQAATGFFYLALITALTAEFAARVGFLPS